MTTEHETKVQGLLLSLDACNFTDQWSQPWLEKLTKTSNMILLEEL